ncbi:phage holin family protein [Gordonia sp. HNM0687]|uniref:Phage holin family protein n=1 Tax=Gordonia mangrovi TaxID=2665643 RepID=A0A6L7GJS2_9ACTN|nr:phage holin family protein [Gordonia mangrovi]MXP20136.1 phage holin family protein [Gordonia mangrovi]UVF79255.1 phage holin family protein [Gordonia mangrovi]
MTEQPPQDLSTVQLVERLQHQTTTLVKTEIRDALDEVKTKSTRLGVGVGVSGVGALLLFFALATFVAAAVLGLANAVDPWLSAVIVGAILLVIGAIVAAIGARRAKAAVPPAPQHTAASVQRDVDTVKEHLR